MAITSSFAEGIVIKKQGQFPIGAPPYSAKALSIPTLLSAGLSKTKPDKVIVAIMRLPATRYLPMRRICRWCSCMVMAVTEFVGKLRLMTVPVSQLSCLPKVIRHTFSTSRPRTRLPHKLYCYSRAGSRRNVLVRHLAHGYLARME